MHPSLWPATTGGTPIDVPTEERITQLLAQMSLEDKVGQMIQADTLSIETEELKQYRLGSVLNGGNSGPNKKPWATPQEWLAMNDAFWDASMSPRDSGPRIPPLFGIDAVHGHAKVVGATVFPHNIGLGATRDPDLVREIAQATAIELTVTGFDWNFSPCLAVVRDPRWGRTYESFSEDPELVARLAGEVVHGAQGAIGPSATLGEGRVLATAKHFLGDGGTINGKDQGDNRSSENDLIKYHALAYPPAIEAGVQTVMASFSSWQGEKMHGRGDLLDGVLKQRMGFTGLLVGDWNAHGQVSGCNNESCPQSISAGLDMFMAPDSWKGLYAATLEQARAGQITQERIDDAVRRILRVKMRAGLLDKGKPSSRPLAGRFELVGSAEHRELARRAVRESLVLLKNEGGVLPLKRKQTVLVVGDGVDSIGKQCGGWTLDWQGGRHPNTLFPGGKSVFEGIKETVESVGGKVTLSETAAFTARPDVAIVVFGEEPYAEFKGDRPTLDFEPSQQVISTLQTLRAAKIPVVSVFLSGRPMFVTPEIEASDAFVAAWLPGTQGEGVADVIFRDERDQIAHDFRGKLSFSWPRAPTEEGNGASAPAALFPFDYGLHYGR